MKKTPILLCLVVIVGGCFGGDNAYSTANEQYAMGWILHNISNQTNTTLDYSLEELAVYNYSFNYPAQQPHEYSNVLFWVAPMLKGAGGFAGAFWNKISVPVDRVYYVMGKNPVPENYGSNWSFSNYMQLNYLTSNNTNRQYAYDSAHQEHYQSENAFYALTPIPGDRIHVYFGTAPFTPPSVFVSDNRLRLRDQLMRGHGGNSYLMRDTKITVTAFPSGESVTSYLAVPAYQIYLNNSLIKEGNLTTNDRWDYSKLNYSLSSDGLYLLNLTIPSDYPVWNITRIVACLRKPSADLNPPTLNHIEVSPRFRVNEPLSIEVNASDESNISGVRVYFNTGGEADWTELAVGFNNSLYNASLTITNPSVNAVNLKVNITDTPNNSIAYIILPVSMKERNFSLNFTSNKNSTSRGDTIQVRGNCTDGSGLNCSGLRLEYYLNDLLLGVDMTNWSDATAGKFSSELQVPYNFTSTSANLSVLFGGSGAYPLKRESISLDVTQYEHNLAAGSLTLGTLRLNERGTINATVHNTGLSNEANISVRLLINGNLNGSVSLPVLNSSQTAALSFNWTPTEAGNYSMNISIDPVPGETNLADNSLEDSIVVGSDVTGEIILDWSKKSVVNKSTATRIRLNNVGNETAVNPTINLYDIYPYNYGCTYYNQTRQMTFGNITYNITTIKLDDSSVRFNISYRNISEAHTLFRTQFAELGSGALLELDYLYAGWGSSPGCAGIYLGNTSTIVIKNLSDIKPGGIASDDVNWTTPSLGYHRLKLFVNVSNDGNPRNNFGSSPVRVRLDMADIYAYINWYWDKKAFANRTNNATVRIYNYGARTATNLSLMFSDMFDHQHFALYYGVRNSICYNGTCRNMTAYAAGDHRVTLNISFGGNSSELTLYERQTTPLDGEVLLYVPSVSSTSILIYLGKAESAIKQLPNIGVDTSSEEIVNFTPPSLGDHILLLGVNTSEDADWTDNFYSYYIKVVVGPPDVFGYIYPLPPPTANSTTNVTVKIYNRGIWNASNTNLRLLQKYRSGTGYSTIGETTAGELEANGEREFVFNWTPTAVGPYVLRLEVNCSWDEDSTNNVYTRDASVPERLANVVINEVLPHPSRGSQEWIELYNGKNYSVNLSGWVLDDTPLGGPTPYTIPDGTVISAHGFTVFHGSQTGIVLGDFGDTVVLSTESGTVADSYTYYNTRRGLSFGRAADGGGEWTTFEVSTPGATNIGVNDTTPPTVSLDFPPDGAVDTDGNIFLRYTPLDQSPLANCTLYTNATGTWAATQLATAVLVNSRNSFGLFDIPNGAYLWNVQCTDGTALSAFAPQNRTFTVNKTADSVFNQQLNLTLNSTRNVTSNTTNVSLEITVTENVTNAYIFLASHSNNTQNVSLSVPGLNKFITIEASTELEESISSYLLKIYYNPDEATAAGLNETDLAIWWYNETLERWITLTNTTPGVYGAGVNATADYVWANVTHFSDYTIAKATQTQEIPLKTGWNLISVPLLI